MLQFQKFEKVFQLLKIIYVRNYYKEVYMQSNYITRSLRRVQKVQIIRYISQLIIKNKKKDIFRSLFTQIHFPIWSNIMNRARMITCTRSYFRSIHLSYDAFSHIHYPIVTTNLYVLQSPHNSNHHQLPACLKTMSHIINN